MFKPDYRHVKKLKEIVDFLNEEFPNPSGDQLFVIYWDKTNSIKRWHITCSDWWTYFDSEDFKVCKKAVYAKYPELKKHILFCHQYVLAIFKLLVHQKTWQDEDAIVIK